MFSFIVSLLLLTEVELLVLFEDVDVHIELFTKITIGQRDARGCNISLKNIFLSFSFS